MIELLAPAKDKKCAIAAIDFGADAIYIGASEFGARKNAPNSIDDIEEIVQYAHKFNVKVYVTINTILTDDELIRAKELIKKLEKINVDAVIVQDMGLIDAKSCHCEESIDEAIQKNLNIPFHASTQCDNRTVEKVKFLESIGFSRVVLARELSIDQIKEIKEKTDVELEVFIHGALCVSYSGQCYLSQLIGGVNGRSANRGECAQPCRKKYSLVDQDGNFIAKDEYLLNLKDFNASKYIKELANAGVTSFKIEGRLKDENYVKNVVGYYRKLIDNLGLEKTSSGKVIFDFEPNLEKSFNRGFTDYFIDGKRKKIFNFDSPKSRGEYIGKVSKVGKDYFEICNTSLRDIKHHRLLQNPTEAISSNFNIHPQDGLCFMEKGELSGCLVNKADKNKIYPNKMDGIKIGTEIYRNFDSEFEKKLKNSKTCRKISLDIEFGLNKIKAVDEDENIAQIGYEFEEFAQNTDKMRENITNQLKKSGETEFFVEDVKVFTDKLPFLPISKLNDLRRELLDKIRGKRQEANSANHMCNCVASAEAIQGCLTFGLPRQGSALTRNDNKVDYRFNILNKSAKEFYEKLGCKVTEMALESGKAKKQDKIAMTTKHCLKYAFNLCKSDNALFLVDEKGKRYKLKFNCEACEMEIIF